MTTRLEALLRKPEPLEPDEAEDLREWLKVLEEDCELFGATAEDKVRIKWIKHRLRN